MKKKELKAKIAGLEDDLGDARLCKEIIERKNDSLTKELRFSEIKHQRELRKLNRKISVLQGEKKALIRKNVKDLESIANQQKINENKFKELQSENEDLKAHAEGKKQDIFQLELENKALKEQLKQFQTPCENEIDLYAKIPNNLSQSETKFCKELIDTLETCKKERQKFEYTIQFTDRYFYIEIHYFGKSIDFQKAGYCDLEYQKEMICELFLSKKLDKILLDLMFDIKDDNLYFIDTDNYIIVCKDCFEHWVYRKLRWKPFKTIKEFEKILIDNEIDLSE